jgi:hypothetical protein
LKYWQIPGFLPQSMRIALKRYLQDNVDLERWNFQAFAISPPNFACELTWLAN